MTNLLTFIKTHIPHISALVLLAMLAYLAAAGHIQFTKGKGYTTLNGWAEVPICTMTLNPDGETYKQSAWDTLLVIKMSAAVMIDTPRADAWIVGIDSTNITTATR